MRRTSKCDYIIATVKNRFICVVTKGHSKYFCRKMKSNAKDFIHYVTRLPQEHWNAEWMLSRYRKY